MKLVFAALLLVGVLTALVPLSPVLRIVVGLLVVVLAVAGLVLERRASVDLD